MFAGFVFWCKPVEPLIPVGAQLSRHIRGILLWSPVSSYCSFFWTVHFSDGDHLDKDLEDLIDDNPIEEGSDSGSDGEGGKKRKNEDESDLEEDLEDEDYDLIKENLGIEVKRKVSELRRKTMTTTATFVPACFKFSATKKMSPISLMWRKNWPFQLQRV